MELAGTVDVMAMPAERAFGLRAANILGKAIFGSLLGLIILTAIPYGTVEPWWKAAFICLVFALGILGIIEGLLSGSWQTGGRALLMPMLALTAFSLLQIVPLGIQALPSIPQSSWKRISADPYQTEFFALQMLGLTAATALLYRYAFNERRLNLLVHVIIGVAVASAIFGMLRQTTQHSVGFFLPLIKPSEGYGQFVNQNHFALLMEMGFGLAIGMIVAGGVRRERALIYFASMLPIWAALVLSNSRGGLLAMIAQLIAAGLLFTFVVPTSSSKNVRLKVFDVARSLPVRVLLLVVLLIAVTLGTLWMGGDRLVSKFEQGRSEHDSAGVSRNEIWRATWKMFTAHPVAGVGMGAYWTVIPAYHNASGTLAPQEAHNEYLEILASGGLIGAAIVSWFCVILLRRIRLNFRSPKRFYRAACFGATLAIVGVAVHSIFDFGLHMMANALIFMALVVIATRASKYEGSIRSRYA